MTTKFKVGDPVIYTGKHPKVVTRALIGCVGWVAGANERFVDVWFVDMPKGIVTNSARPFSAAAENLALHSEGQVAIGFDLMEGGN